MKIVGVFILSFILFGCAKVESTRIQKNIPPKTLESAVKVVLSEMSKADKISLKSISQDNIFETHRGLAKEIENKFWPEYGNKNEELFESVCRGCFCTEEMASRTILCGVWNSLNKKSIGKDVFVCAIPSFNFVPDQENTKIEKPP